ncbi:DUF4236 domain-containing protein [Serpentinicella sp. ANB-PHB4]|uniref:DUF4236 domain-containing protein n=1 Tax=Serpentinicella sp. ANB-PHB4 TaxID=3074076 RepID=UPI00285D9716|nr:DUF4236 domain-containing protein [Serpentinicella sp. ANB-PHB4]MDR5659477.1 DUF4236 domain-containing protein [Serpentinicella sp. ANB-PHB4]
MGLRLRKSINMGKGMRLNLSKRGVGVSAGVKGFRVGVGPRGIRKTTSIPGTGISHVTEHKLSTKSPTSSAKSNVQNKRTYYKNQDIKGYGWFWGMILGGIISLANPPAGLPLVLASAFMFLKTSKKPEAKSALAFNKGVKSLNNGNYADAIQFLEQAVNYNENNYEAHDLLAKLYFDKTANYKKALFHAKKMLLIKPYNIEMLFLVGKCYFELKEYDLSIESLQNMPKEGFLYEKEKTLLLGRCFFKKEIYELAVEQFKLGPVNKRTITDEVLEAKYWLGMTYYKLGDKKRAKSQLAKVYSTDINYRDIKEVAEDLEFI